MNRHRILWLGVIGALALSCARATTHEPRVAEQQEVTITCELTQAPKWSDIPVFESATDCLAATRYVSLRALVAQGLSRRHAAPLALHVHCRRGRPREDGEYGRLAQGPGLRLSSCSSNPKTVRGHRSLAISSPRMTTSVQRVGIQEGLKFATGISGGARASSVFVQIRPGFSGLILQGAGLAYKTNGVYVVAGLRRTPPIYVAMTMGDHDKHQVEVEDMRRWIGSSHFQSFAFPGGHEWAPAETFERAIAWVEDKVRETAQPQPPQKVN